MIQNNFNAFRITHTHAITVQQNSDRIAAYQVDVNGPNTAPVYQFLKSSAGGFLGDLIKWNFEKFLVDKNGKVVEGYPPTTSPFQIEVGLFFLPFFLFLFRCTILNFRCKLQLFQLLNCVLQLSKLTFSKHYLSSLSIGPPTPPLVQTTIRIEHGI